MNGILSRVKSIFGKNKNKKYIKKREKEEEEEEEEEKKKKDPLDVLIDKYIKNKQIDIPFVPDVLERNIYKTIFSHLFDTINEKCANFEATFFHHKITTNFSPFIIKSLIENEQPSDTQNALYAKNPYIEDLVNAFLETNDMKSVLNCIPRHIQFNLYKNILVLILAVINDTIKCTMFNFMGQCVKMNIEPITHFIKKIDREETVKVLNKKNPVIENMVDEVMGNNNILLIPDFIERHLYKVCFTIVFFFFTHIINDMKISFLHHIIDIQVRAVNEKKEKEKD